MLNALRAIVLSGLAAALLATPVLADEMKMTGPEISEAFNGNTVQGFWGETEYRSYFDPDGTTIYATRGREDIGTWRVKGDQYCSVWAGSGEDCYDLLRDGDQIIWLVPGTDKRYPSTLVEGKALGF